MKVKRVHLVIICFCIIALVATFWACGDDDDDDDTNVESCLDRSDACGTQYQDDEACPSNPDVPATSSACEEWCNCLMEDGNPCDAEWTGNSCIGQ